MQRYRKPVYEAIKAKCGDWINLDELVQLVKVNRSELSKMISSMMRCKDYPGIKRSSKRRSEKLAFGTQKAVYDIKYKYIGE